MNCHSFITKCDDLTVSPERISRYVPLDSPSSVASTILLSGTDKVSDAIILPVKEEIISSTSLSAPETKSCIGPLVGLGYALTSSDTNIS